MDNNTISYPTNANEYILKSELGVGEGDVVYRAKVRNKPDLPECAVKVMNLDRKEVHLDSLMKEINLIHSFRHKNIANLYVTFVNGSDLWMVMPVYTGGSCRKIMKNINPNGFQDEKIIATILKGTLSALSYLHNEDMIHRDIKGSNILITNDGVVKLADFGIAAVLPETRQARTFIGTPCWMAPEVIEQTRLNNGYNSKADIWSLGITALELAFGVPPYASYKPIKAMVMILTDKPPSISTYNEPNRKFSSQFHRFISKCLHKNPKKRPSPDELLNCSFIKKYAMDDNYLKENVINLLPVHHIQGIKVDIKDNLHLNIGDNTNNNSNNDSNMMRADSWVFDDPVLNQVFKEVDKVNSMKLDVEGDGLETPLARTPNIETDINTQKSSNNNNIDDKNSNMLISPNSDNEIKSSSSHLNDTENNSMKSPLAQLFPETANAVAMDADKNKQQEMKESETNMNSNVDYKNNYNTKNDDYTDDNNNNINNNNNNNNNNNKLDSMISPLAQLFPETANAAIMGSDHANDIDQDNNKSKNNENHSKINDNNNNKNSVSDNSNSNNNDDNNSTDANIVKSPLAQLFPDVASAVLNVSESNINNNNVTNKTRMDDKKNNKNNDNIDVTQDNNDTSRANNNDERNVLKTTNVVERRAELSSNKLQNKTVNNDKLAKQSLNINAKPVTLSSPSKKPANEPIVRPSTISLGNVSNHNKNDIERKISFKKKPDITQKTGTTEKTVRKGRFLVVSDSVDNNHGDIDNRNKTVNTN